MGSAWIEERLKKKGGGSPCSVSLRPAPLPTTTLLPWGQGGEDPRKWGWSLHLQKVSSSPWSSPEWEAQTEPILLMGKVRVGTGGSSAPSFPPPWLQQGPNEAVLLRGRKAASPCSVLLG